MLLYYNTQKCRDKVFDFMQSGDVPGTSELGKSREGAAYRAKLPSLKICTSRPSSVTPVISRSAVPIIKSS